MSWQERKVQNLKRNWLVLSKLTPQFDEFWLEHSNVSKICTLMGSFWTKYIKLELKKYRGAKLHGTEEWCKIWRKTDLWFRECHAEFCKFLPEHLRILKLGLWLDPFIQSRKSMRLKVIEELCIMTMKNYAKFEEESTYRFKTDTIIWRILTRNSCT